MAMLYALHSRCCVDFGPKRVDLDGLQGVVGSGRETDIWMIS